MHGTQYLRYIKNIVLLVTLSLALSGCLSDESATTETTEDVLSDIELSGSVGDGPIVGASMRVIRNDGTILTQFESDSDAGYNITVKTKGKFYPLTIDARNGVDLVTNTTPDFELFSAVLEPGRKAVANVNPFSTFVVEIARDWPGNLSKENLRAAQDVVVSALSFGLASIAASGPMNTPIDDTNVAEMVKASETLAEMVRRTRDLRQMFGTSITANEVIRILSSDLGDDLVDGRGGIRSDARISAISIVTSAQVLLEAMSNELHVNGVNATDAMTAAINQISRSQPQTTILDLTVTPEMLTTVATGLAAAIAATNDEKVAELQRAVSGIQAGMNYLLVQSLLPDDYRATLDNVLLAIAGGDQSVIDAVNDSARNGGGELSPNRAPTIFGNPPAQVTADSPYSFTPVASDPDGDSLAFTIAGKPAWVDFDGETGRLFGTPTAGDVGTYNDIIIAVNDGEFTSSLPAFSITVMQATPSNSAPSISGMPSTTVNAGNKYSFTPTASDPDGDVLTFTVTGKPAWANFDSSTGRLSGTPGDADVGTYSDISITVTDGSAGASLAPFTITVNAISLGSVTLNWTPPTENDDGSALADLAGYKIYWGTTPGSYPNSVTVENPGLSSYVVDNLPPGTYEFVATSFNSAGVESVYSNPATKVLN